METSMADEAQDRREAQLRAAYIFNFVKFVAWPARPPADAINICFHGAQDVHDALAAAIAAKGPGASRIIVRSLRPAESPEACQVVYVDSRQGVSTVSWPDSVAALTIGDAGNFTRNGGVIQLYTEGNRLRFIVNVGNAKRAGVQVSSNLLTLATRVEQEVPL
jgi:hypothetical protein